MIKKKFRVIETRTATAYWVYEVDAESEEEAKKLVEELPTKQIVQDHFTEVDWDADAEIEYQEI
jgi:hypothetical protein